MHVSQDDRIAAALLRIEYAEETIRQARKILEYEEIQETKRGKNTETAQEDRQREWGLEQEDGLYPGQIKDPTTPDEESDECET
jgi:hypothetical protein